MKTTKMQLIGCKVGLIN